APRIGLALGSGGARGLTHLGVLKGLIKHGIPIDVVAGSSMGAVVGAMYAATLDVTWMEQRFREMLTSEAYAESGIDWVKVQSPGAEPGFLQWAARYVRNKLVLNFSDSRSGVVNSARLARVIEFLLPVRTFEELRIPFACCAVDLNSGQNVVLDQGDLIQAVVASGCIPGYLAPVTMDDKLLIDGAAGEPIPGAVAHKLGADFVIAVDVSINRFEPLAEQNILGILGRASEITATKLSQAQEHQWDFHIHPDTLNLHWTQFDHLERLILNGEQAVDERIDALQQKLRQVQGVKGYLRRKTEHVRALN
ncbi:MAG: patatin-like phospholipase family protein, partial [Candidatus Neomarinimicrobiota bacterium]